MWRVQSYRVERNQDGKETDEEDQVDNYTHHRYAFNLRFVWVGEILIHAEASLHRELFFDVSIIVVLLIVQQA